MAFEAAPARPPATGVATYVRELGRALSLRSPERIRLIGVHPQGELAELESRVQSSRLTGRYSLWLVRRAESEARAAGAALVHYTNGLAPVRVSLPFVLTIHDLSLVRRPLGHPAVRLLTAPLMPAAARRARAIIVPSETTARDVVRTFRVPRSRVVVIPEAPAALAAVPVDEAERTLRRRGLTARRYLLNLGSIDGRKNHRRLLAAFEQLAGSRPELDLVIAGSHERGSGRLLQAVARSAVAERVKVLGYVDDAERSVLLGNAAALAYVSLFEGYGLPIIEGMAAGVPVVTSSRGATAETAGGAAVLVEPTSTESIAAGLSNALDDRERLVRAGLERVAPLSWEAAADRTMAVYESVWSGLADGRGS